MREMTMTAFSKLVLVSGFCLVSITTASWADGGLKKIYFSSQIDRRSANVSVRVGEKTCKILSNEVPSVDRAVGFVGEDGVTERLATCEFELAPGQYDYEVSMTPASGKTRGFIYYWALDDRPIDNKRAMSAWFMVEDVNPMMRLKISNTDAKLSTRKPIHDVGQIVVQ